MCILLFSHPIHRFFSFSSSQFCWVGTKKRKENHGQNWSIFFSQFYDFSCANNCNQLASLLSRAKFIIICIVSENFFLHFFVDFLLLPAAGLHF